MRRTTGLVALGVVATATALAVTQSSGSSLLAGYGKALNDAKSVRSTYTIQTIGSTSEEYSIAFKKPNLARIESPTTIVVADGKQVTQFTKGDGTYFKRPQTDADIKTFLAPDDLNIFAGFFDPNAYQTPRAKALGQKQINGSSLNLVEASASHKVTTYYLDASDNVARKSQIDVDSSGGKVTRILNTSSLELNPELTAKTFTFDPPAGARELSQDEISSGRWFTDFDEACKIAKAGGKRVFIDFMATWCGPCKMLEAACFHTDEFKHLAKNFVFCRIDVDQQPTLASRFKASSIPLQVVTDSSGNEIDRTVGYGGAAPFFQFMHKNAK